MLADGTKVIALALVAWFLAGALSALLLYSVRRIGLAGGVAAVLSGPLALPVALAAVIQEKPRNEANAARDALTVSHSAPPREGGAVAGADEAGAEGVPSSDLLDGAAPLASADIKEPSTAAPQHKSTPAPTYSGGPAFLPNTPPPVDLEAPPSLDEVVRAEFAIEEGSENQEGRRGRMLPVLYEKTESAATPSRGRYRTYKQAYEEVLRPKETAELPRSFVCSACERPSWTDEFGFCSLCGSPISVGH